MAAGAPLCAFSDEPIPAAETKLPRNLCPLIKASYGFALTDTCPYFYFSDFILGETTCDGKRKMFELMNELKETYVMQLPHSRDEAASRPRLLITGCPNSGVRDKIIKTVEELGADAFARYAGALCAALTAAKRRDLK